MDSASFSRWRCSATVSIGPWDLESLQSDWLPDVFDNGGDKRDL